MGCGGGAGRRVIPQVAYLDVWFTVCICTGYRLRHSPRPLFSLLTAPSRLHDSTAPAPYPHNALLLFSSRTSSFFCPTILHLPPLRSPHSILPANTSDVINSIRRLDSLDQIH